MTRRSGSSSRRPAAATRTPGRRPPLRRWLVIAVVAAGALAGVALWAVRRSHDRPNIVLITIDTLRADHVGSYGDRDAATPTLDALARAGVRFADVIAPAPLTLPSHASILTGLTPPRHGIRNNPGFALPASVPTITEAFRAAGYETAAFVSGFPLHRRFGLARGFDTYDDRFPRGDGAAVAPFTERRADQTVTAVRDWLTARTARSETRPYFLWVHFFDPHRPYDPPEPFRARFTDRPYDGEIAFVDAQVGALLQALGDPSRAHTTVAVMSDHGEGLNEHDEPTHGLLIYTSTMHVPLIFSGAGIPNGRVVTSLARLIDVAPTLAELAGLAPMRGIEGRSLVPAARGDGAAKGAATASEPAYVESMFGRLCCGWAPLAGWREGRWMYIDAPEPELYDVDADPGEQHNVAASHAADVARFARAVRAAGAPVGGSAARSTSESSARMASLGYFSGGDAVRPSLQDPKRMARLAERMEDAIARERQDPKAAARDLRDIVNEDPSNPLARRHLAIALSEMHDYGAAIEEIGALERLGDTSVETTLLLGDCQRLGGDPAAAVRTLTAASARDRQNPDLLDALGRALTSAGQAQAGAEAFARALALQPDDPEALEGSADLAIARGDVDDARRWLEALRRRDPADVRTSVKLGAVLARTGQLPDAIALFRSVVRSAPDDVDALVNLAAALAKSGDTAEAIPYFERAVAAGATAPVVFNGLGVARLQSGDRAGAAEALRRSLAVKADQPDIRRLLDQIASGGARP